MFLQEAAGLRVTMIPETIVIYLRFKAALQFIFNVIWILLFALIQRIKKFLKNA